MSSSSGIGGLISLFVHELRPIVGLLMVHTVFGAILIPLLFTLLYFSTARFRCTPIFWIILFDVMIGVGVAIWYDTVMLSVLFDPLAGIPRQTYIAFDLVQTLVTWVVDASLLFRLAAVFPRASTPTRKSVAVFAFSALIKAARLAVIVAAAAMYAPTVSNVSNATTAATTSNLSIVNNPLLIAESACQLSDHAYMSGLFLWKLRFSFTSAKDSGRISDGTRDSVAGRIRTLFFIALGNFVFPVLFNIVLIAIITADKNHLDVIYVFPTNMYATIIGVVFATVWNSSHAVSTEASRPSPPSKSKSVPLPLAFRRSNSTGSGGPFQGAQEHTLQIIQRA